MINPFRKNDPNRIKSLQLEEEVRTELAELSRVANEILLDQRYRKFTKLVEDAEKNTIDLLLSWHKSNDTNKYKKYDELLIELGVYRTLIHSISDLANPKQDQTHIGMTQRFKGQIREILDSIK